jgi:DNA-binding response OmpR family regulator
MKILIIEDEPELSSSIIKYLSGENYLCELASSFAEAIEKITLYDYECIILDLMLPGGDGMNILREIRRQGKGDGVIIISAKGSLENKLEGLKSGADDYLHKPFHLAELAARIQSVIRRKQFGSSNSVQEHEIHIDLLARTVKVNDTEVPLTKKE